MKKKSLMYLAVVVALCLGLAGISHAVVDDDRDDATGTVTKIVGNAVTVKQLSEKEITLEVKALKELKVGDYVVIEDYKVKKINPERKKGLDLN